jgi:hypothetical protein
LDLIEAHEGDGKRSLTPFSHERQPYNRKHKNDSTNVDRIFMETLDERAALRKRALTPHNRSVDYSHGYVRGLGNLKNEDQLEEVFAPKHIIGDEEFNYMTLN